MMEVQMPEGIDVFGLEASDLSDFVTMDRAAF
jgi:hypothetical protein